MTFGLFDLFGMSDSFITLTIGLLGGFIYRQWVKDHFKSLERYAVYIEEGWFKKIGFDWNTLGNPVSWLHHTMFTFAVSLLGVGIAHVTGTGLFLGAAVWGSGFVVFYLLREGRGFYEDRGRTIGPMFKRKHPYTSRVVDGIMDVVGPALYAAWLWMLV